MGTSATGRSLLLAAAFTQITPPLTQQPRQHQTVAVRENFDNDGIAVFLLLLSQPSCYPLHGSFPY
jgi:hypothetical protein